MKYAGDVIVKAPRSVLVYILVHTESLPNLAAANGRGPMRQGRRILQGGLWFRSFSEHLRLKKGKAQKKLNS